jgi:hypothetical protein
MPDDVIKVQTDEPTIDTTVPTVETPVPVPEDSGFMVAEMNYLMTIPEDEREELMQDKLGVRQLTRAWIADRITSEPNFSGTWESALEEAEQQIHLQEIPEPVELTVTPSPARATPKAPPPPPPEHSWYGELARGIVRAPIAAIVRTADAIRTLPIGKALEALDWSGEKLTGIDLFTDEQIREFQTAMTPETEEYLISLGNSIEFDKQRISGRFTQDISSVLLTMLLLKSVAPTAQLGTTLSKVKNGSRVMNAIRGFISANIHGTAAVVLAAPKGTGVEAVMAGAERMGWTEKGTAESFRKYLESRPVWEQKVVMATDDLLGGVLFSMVGKVLKESYKWISKGVSPDKVLPAVQKVADSVLEPMAEESHVLSTADSVGYKPDADVVKALSPDDLSGVQTVTIVETPLKQFDVPDDVTLEFFSAAPRPKEVPYVVERNPFEFAQVDEATRLTEQYIAKAAPEEVAVEATKKVSKKVAKKAPKKTPSTPKGTTAKVKRASKKTKDVVVETELPPAEIVKEVENTKTSDVIPIDEQELPPSLRPGAPVEPSVTDFSEAAYGNPRLVKFGTNSGIVVETIEEAELLGSTIKAFKGDLKKVLKDVLPANHKYRKVLERLVNKKGKVVANSVIDGISGENLGSALDMMTPEFKAGMKAAKGDPAKIAEVVPKILQMRKGRPRGGFGADTVADLALASAKYLMKVPVNPLAAVGVTVAADMVDGKADLSLEDYLMLTGTIMAGRYMWDAIRLSRGRLSKEAADVVAAQVAQGNLDLLAVAKTVTSPEGQAAIFTETVENVLNAPVKRASKTISQIARHLDVGDSTIDATVDLSREYAEAMGGKAIGNLSLVKDSALLTPLTMHEGILEAITFVNNKLSTQTLTKEGAAAVTLRWDRFISDYGVSQTMVGNLGRFISGSSNPEMTRQAIMVALDSFERKLFKTLGAAAHKFDGTLASAAAFNENLSKLAMFRKILSGDSILDAERHGSQLITSLFMRQIPEDMVPRIAGTGMRKYLKTAKSQAAVFKALISPKGVVPQVMREKLIQALVMLDSPRGLTETVVSGVYHAMLSSMSMFKDSVVGNAISQSYDVLRHLGEVGLGTITRHEGQVMASKAWLDKYFGAFTEGLKNTKATLETGTKVFDPQGVKPQYSHSRAIDVARGMGGGDDTANLVLKGMDRFSDLFGVKPGEVAQAIDVMPQTMSHAAYLEKFIIQDAYEKSLRDTTRTFEQHLKDIRTNPEMLAEVSERALLHSRGSVFLGAEPKELIRQDSQTGTWSTYLGKDPMTGVLESANKSQKAHPIMSLFQPFLSTSLFASHRGMRWHPLTSFMLDVATKDGLTRSLLTKAAKDETSKAIRLRMINEVGAKVVAGFGVICAIDGLMSSLGYDYISPMASLDTKYKNLGVRMNSYFRVSDGQSMDLSRQDNLRPLLVALDVTKRSLNGELSPEETGDATGLMLAFEALASSATPDVLLEFWERMGRIKGTSESRGDRIAEAMADFFGDVLARAEPQLVSHIRSFTDEYVKERNLQSVFIESQPKLNKLGNPVRQNLLLAPGREQQVPVGEAELSLAKAGVDVSAYGNPTYGGKRIDDQLLANDIKKIQGEYVQKYFPMFQLGSKGLAGDKLKEFASAFMNDARGYALGDPRVMERLEKFALDNGLIEE